MSNEESTIFDLTHSLPAVAHSVSLATRTPTASYPQESKYIPDYGGILETPESHIKNNSIIAETPFKSSGPAIYVKEPAREIDGIDRSRRDYCIAASSYLDQSDSYNNFSMIRTIAKHLCIDSVSQRIDGSYEAFNYVDIPYSDNIVSFKYLDTMDDIIIINFEQGVKTISLNRGYQVSHASQESEMNSSNDSTALNFFSSIKETIGFRTKDACLNMYNRCVQAIASDNIEFNMVKLYDVSVTTRQPIQTIQWPSEELSLANQLQGDQTSMPRLLRSFKPSRPTKYGIQQVDNMPSHLVNILATSAHKTVLIDPRSDSPRHSFVDKAKITSFYPVEFIRKTVFSRRNEYQFYSLSNVHLRVFDTRYPMVPMNQISHMLAADGYETMEGKLITFRESNIETLCCISEGRVCFSSFDQSQESSLVNPKSLHLPKHEPNPMTRWNVDERDLYGLAILQPEDSSESKDSWLFTVINLLNNELCLRHYEVPNDDDSSTEIDVQSQSSVIPHPRELYHPNRSMNESDESDSETVIVDYLYRAEPSEEQIDQSKYIDILDEEVTIDFEDRVESRMAVDRFASIKNKLSKQ